MAKKENVAHVAKVDGASPWSMATSRVRAASASIAADEARDRVEARQHTLKGMSRKERKALFAKTNGATFKDYTHLLAVKPRQGYVFHSDYFEIDGGVNQPHRQSRSNPSGTHNRSVMSTIFSRWVENSES